MGQLLIDEPNVGRPKSNRNDATAKIDADLLRLAKVVATYEGKTLAEYLTEILRPVVESDHRAHVARISKTEGVVASKKRKWSDDQFRSFQMRANELRAELKDLIEGLSEATKLPKEVMAHWVKAYNLLLATQEELHEAPFAPELAQFEEARGLVKEMESPAPRKPSSDKPLPITDWYEWGIQVKQIRDGVFELRSQITASSNKGYQSKSKSRDIYLEIDEGKWFCEGLVAKQYPELAAASRLFCGPIIDQDQATAGITTPS